MIKKHIKEEINNLILKIEKFNNKNVQNKLLFNDTALIANQFAKDYEELGELYIQVNDFKNAVKAFQEAERADMVFIKSEFSYDPKFMKETMQGRKAYWKDKISKTQKIDN